MKLTLRKVSQAGNNVVAQLSIDGRIVTPQGMHMNPTEFDELTIILSGGCAMSVEQHQFEVDDR